MSIAKETLKSTSNPEALPQERDLKIAGTLRDPLVQPIGADQLGISYHWETPDDNHTYLHLTLRKSPDESFAVAHANMDSEDIKARAVHYGPFSVLNFKMLAIGVILPSIMMLIRTITHDVYLKLIRDM